MQGLPMTNAPRVLLVEDDPAIARTVCYALERDGIAVRHCLQLADARAQWQAQPPDAVLLDVGLPDGNGLDWCRELRQAGCLEIRRAADIIAAHLGVSRATVYADAK